MVKKTTGKTTGSKSASPKGGKAAAKKRPAAKSGAKSTAKPAAKSTSKPKFDAEKALYFYREMLLIRRFEEKAGQLYGMGLIGGFCHLYIGEEAVITGMRACTTDDDAIVTSYRDHGHMLACDMDPKGVMAELTGRAGGYSRGKGGSMHMFSKEKNFYGGHGIVGAQVPIGTGLAFSFKYRNEPHISLTFLGDGAVNQGQVYESFNMSALWKLPAVYVIENNRYGMGTSVDRAAAHGSELFLRGEAYGIPGEPVDGMDVFAVEEAGRRAVTHARSGKGPYILEMKTYRYRGHSMSDPAKYRTKEEVDKVKHDLDPIAHVRQILLDKKIATEDSLKDIDREIKEVVGAAADFSRESPEPDVAELYTDILAEG